METLRITQSSLSYSDFAPLFSGPILVSIDRESRSRIKRSHERLKDLLSSGQTVYGVNTGFGKLSEITIEPEEQFKLQLNLVRSHSARVGTCHTISKVIDLCEGVQRCASGSGK